MVKFKIKNTGNYLNLDVEFKRFNLLLGDHNPTVRLARLVHTFLKRESYWEVNNFKDEKYFFEKPFDAIMSSPNKMAIYSCQDLFFGLEVLKIVDNNPKKYKDDLGLFGVTEGVVYDLLNKTSRDTFLSQFAVTYINKN